MASQPQLNFLKGIRRYRDLSSLSEEQRSWIMGLTANDLVHETTTITFDQVKRVLDKCANLPNAPKPNTQLADQPWVRLAEGIPAGRYAVENEEGELRFYQLWRPRDHGDSDFWQLYVLHGPDSSRVHNKAAGAIVQKIRAAGIREAAIRFGNEIGACSNCGHRLTNRISRELGIGPVCGGRMFGDGGWKTEVREARERIKARGENPDEEVE